MTEEIIFLFDNKIMNTRINSYRNLDARLKNRPRKPNIMLTVVSARASCTCFEHMLRAIASRNYLKLQILIIYYYI